MKDTYLNLFLRKPAVACQALSKIGLFTCTCLTYSAFHSFFAVKGGNSFWTFVGGT